MTQEEFRGIISKLDPEALRDLGVRTRHMIDHIAKRIEYTETRRGFFLTTGGAMFAAGIAVIGLAISKPVWFPIYIFLWVLGPSLVIFAVIIWMVHARHVNFQYPFTSVAQIGKWFYRYAIPNWMAYQIPWIRNLADDQRKSDKGKFEADFLTFLGASEINLLNLRETYIQDIMQIYLLHVNEMYKNRFLSSLRKTFQWGVLLVLMFSICGFLFGLCINSYRWPAKEAHPQLGLQVQSTWYPTYSTAASNGNFNIVLKNQSNKPITITGVGIVDDRGLQLPFDIVNVNCSFPLTVMAGSDFTIAAVLDVRGNTLSQVHAVLLRP